MDWPADVVERILHLAGLPIDTRLELGITPGRCVVPREVFKYVKRRIWDGRRRHHEWGPPYEENTVRLAEVAKGGFRMTWKVCRDSCFLHHRFGESELTWAPSTRGTWFCCGEWSDKDRDWWEALQEYERAPLTVSQVEGLLPSLRAALAALPPFDPGPPGPGKCLGCGGCCGCGARIVYDGDALARAVWPETLHAGVRRCLVGYCRIGASARQRQWHMDSDRVEDMVEYLARVSVGDGV